MATIQKMYFHDVNATASGTLAGPFGTFDVTATGGGTLRDMGATIGTLQTSGAGATLAQTAGQTMLLRTFVGPNLAAQTIASGTWTVSCAISESNTNSGFTIEASRVYLVNTVGGAYRSEIVNVTGTASATASEAAVSFTFTGLSVSAFDGDVVVIQLARSFGAQSKSTSYTNTVFYDGTTEASAATNAAYLLAPNALTLQGTVVAPPDVTTARTRT